MLKKSLGDLGEKVAQKFLRKQGYRIVEVNYRCIGGEIDIIATDKKTLVFVEVRSKSNIVHGLPVETIDQKKQNKIRYAAQQYIYKNNLEEMFCRFDVVSIVWEKEKSQIELYKDAF